MREEIFLFLSRMTKMYEENRPCSHRGKFSMKTVGDEDGKIYFRVGVWVHFGWELFDAQPQIDNGNVFSWYLLQKKHKTIYKENFFLSVSPVFCTWWFTGREMKISEIVFRKFFFFLFGGRNWHEAHFRIFPTSIESWMGNRWAHKFLNQKWFSICGKLSCSDTKNKTREKHFIIKFFPRWSATHGCNESSFSFNEIFPLNTICWGLK